MAHFAKSKKAFNAFIDRLINLDHDEPTEIELEEHLNDNTLESFHKTTTNFKSEK